MTLFLKKNQQNTPIFEVPSLSLRIFDEVSVSKF